MNRHAHLPTPPDRRPYRPMYESGTMVEAFVPDGSRTYRQSFRQVGWIGQSGAFYALGEGVDPKDHEPGGFAPLYFVAHSDTIAAEDLGEVIAKIREKKTSGAG